MDLIFLPRIQPIEIVKPFFIIILSLIISYEKLSGYITKFSFSLILTLLIAIFLLIQPDLGQTLIIGFSWLILIFISGINLLLLGLVVIIGISFLLYATFLYS